MSDKFFEGVDQIKARLAGVECKMPVFYRSARMFTLIFPARLGALRSLLPDRRFKPGTLMPGVGAVHLTAFEYYDCDIGPYNEFAVGALLASPDFARVPGYNVTQQLLQNSFHTYILELPVTTEVARKAGVDLYNYPKFLASIDFQDRPDELSCTLAENSELICRLTGKKLGTKPNGVMQNFCHLYHDRQPQSSEMKVDALQYGIAVGPGNATLELGKTHRVAKLLDRLLLSKTPVLYTYMPEMRAILYGPEHLSLSLVARFLEQGLNVSMGTGKAAGERSATSRAPV